jgi:hypothetical protein
VEEILKKIKIVALNKILVHERVMSRAVHNLCKFLEEAGIQKNPIVVHKVKNRYIVLDGMHRVEAFRSMWYRDIMVYEVDYFNEEIKLAGWDGVIFGKMNYGEMLQELFTRTWAVRKEGRRVNLQKLVKDKKVLFGLRDRSGQYAVTLKKQRPENLPHNQYLDAAVSAVQRIENYLDIKNRKIQYVPETASDPSFQTLRADALLYRPVYTKADIIHRTLTGKVFPRKSTRHIIPSRPLRVDINLIILKEKMDLKAKNKLLQSHLLWCFQEGRVRYYPEPVYIFAD